VLDSAGNLFDTISIAVRAALATTSIPKVNVIEKPGKQYELELSDDPEDSLKVDAVGVPVAVTFSKVRFPRPLPTLALPFSLTLKSIPRSASLM
jgi:exosome complex component RRP42